METTGIKKAAKFLLTKFLLPLAFLGVLGYYASTSLGISDVLEKVDLRVIPILMLLSLLFFLSNGLVMKTVLRLFDVHLPLYRCVGITALTSVANSLTPYGGTIGKAAYLRRHDFTYPEFLASMSAVQILGFAVVGTVGFFISFSIDVLPEIWRMPVVSTFALVGIASISLILLPLDFRGRQGRISRVAANVAEGNFHLGHIHALIL